MENDSRGLTCVSPVRQTIGQIRGAEYEHFSEADAEFCSCRGGGRVLSFLTAHRSRTARPAGRGWLAHGVRRAARHHSGPGPGDASPNGGNFGPGGKPEDVIDVEFEEKK